MDPSADHTATVSTTISAAVSASISSSVASVMARARLATGVFGQLDQRQVDRIVDAQASGSVAAHTVAPALLGDIQLMIRTLNPISGSLPLPALGHPKAGGHRTHLREGALSDQLPEFLG